MKEDEDKFVDKLMDILLEMDSGISIHSKSFKDYGAADPFYITGSEIVAKMSPQGEDDEYAAAMALFNMFDQENKEDAYCMDKRFTADTSEFVTWGDIKIMSTKLRGKPIDS